MYNIKKHKRRNDDKVNNRVSGTKTKELTGVAILAAIIVVLQLFATFFSSFLPFARLTFTLVPIVIGGALYGIKAGALLGGVFGAIVLGSMIGGTGGEFGTLIINKMPLAACGVTLARCILAGFIPALVFKLFSKKDAVVGAFVAALLCPVVNTGIYFLGVVFVFMDMFFEANNIAGGNIYWLLLTSIAVNFTIEFIINTILSPVIITVIKVRRKQQG